MKSNFKIMVVVLALILIGVFIYYYTMKPTPIVEEIPIVTENETKVPTFTWKYEQADSLNLDGVPNTNIFLEAKYENGIIQNKLVDTTAGSCNDLPEKDSDSVENSTNIQCYSAGLGYRFKITRGSETYLVQRKAFEEALPNYTPPLYQYEVISEFLFSE